MERVPLNGESNRDSKETKSSITKVRIGGSPTAHDRETPWNFDGTFVSSTLIILIYSTASATISMVNKRNKPAGYGPTNFHILATFGG